MIRTHRFRTHRALLFQTLEALEGRALLTASPTSLLTAPVALPITVVAPHPPVLDSSTTGSADAIAANSSVLPRLALDSNSGGSSSTPAAAPPDPTSGSSASSGSDPSATGSSSGGSNSGGSSDSTDRGNPQRSQMVAQLAQLVAAYDQIQQLQQNAQTAVDNDNRAIQQNTGVLNAIQARIDSVTAQEETLTAQIASLSQDSTADGQMVAAYLEGEFEALQEQEIGLNASEAAYEQAIADAQQQLGADTATLNRIYDQSVQLYQQIQDLRFQISNTPASLP